MKKALCLLLALCLLPVCALSESVEDSLVVGMISTRTMAIDPFLPQERDIVSLYALMFESLVTLDDDGIPQPHLASNWTASSDGKTWTFTIRENVTFSDGTPLTAYHVAACGTKLLELCRDEKDEPNGNFYSNMVRIVKSFEAKDDRTLIVKAKRPFYGLLYSMIFPIALETAEGSGVYLGTGPYICSSFMPTEYMILKANDYWWQTPPQVQEIMATFFGNNKDMITAYEYGRVDTVFTRSVSAAQYRSGNTSLSISYSTRQLEVLLLNNRDKSRPLNETEARRAIRYAINKELISRNAYMGMTQNADTPYPSNSWLYLDQESAFVYNRDKAAAILAALGWSDFDGNGVLDHEPTDGGDEAMHLVLSLYVYEDPENDVRYETANMIADMLAEIGVSVHVETVSYERAKEVIAACSYDMFLCSYQMDIVPDPGFLLEGSNTGKLNYYKSSEMNEYFKTLRLTSDQTEFALTSQKIQQLFAEDVPFICLFYRTGALLTRKMYTTVRTIREFEVLRGIESFGR